MSWELRRANVADLDAIMAIESTVFEEDAWSPAMMRGDLVRPECYYLVAVPVVGPGETSEPDDAPAADSSEPTTGGSIEAYAGLLCPQGAKEGDIQTIAVSEQARGHGLGRVLMQSLINEARRRGAAEVFLEVRADNAVAQKLYLSLGFVQIGVRRGYYQPGNVDAQVMRLIIPEPVAAFTVGAA